MGNQRFGRQEARPSKNGSSKEASRKPPVHEVRIKQIRAVVWENDSDEQGRWFSVTISRSYKQGEEWKTATSFGRDDLLVVAECARLAWLWIAKENGSMTGDDDSDSDSNADF